MNKRIIKICLFSTLGIFAFSQVHSKEEITREKLRSIRGQAGVFFEPDEIFIKVRYKDLTYTDTDGYGSITSAGIKIEYDGEFSTLEFKPIKNPLEYSNSNLKAVFGEKIGNVGLTEYKTDGSIDQLPEINDFILPVSNLAIGTATLCKTFTAINLFNRGFSPDLPVQKISELTGGNKNFAQGIEVSLPSVESEFSPRTSHIMITGAQSPDGVRNNDKILFTIQWGESKTAILGGKIEIRPND